MNPPSHSASLRRVCREIAAVGIAKEQAAPYIAALVSWGPLSPHEPPDVAAAFAAGFPAYSHRLREMIAAASAAYSESLDFAKNRARGLRAPGPRDSESQRASAP